jgi:hypothetical protein
LYNLIIQIFPFSEAQKAMSPAKSMAVLIVDSSKISFYQFPGKKVQLSSERRSNDEGKQVHEKEIVGGRQRAGNSG